MNAVQYVYVDQDPDDLQLFIFLVPKKFSLSELRLTIFQSLKKIFGKNVFEGHIIGESHMWACELPKTNFSLVEVFACCQLDCRHLEMLVCEKGRDLFRQGKITLGKKHKLPFQYDLQILTFPLNEFINYQMEGDAVIQQIFPRGRAVIAPQTSLSVKQDKGSLIIRSFHSYPSRRKVVLTASVFTPD